MQVGQKGALYRNSLGKTPLDPASLVLSSLFTWFHWKFASWISFTWFDWKIIRDSTGFFNHARHISESLHALHFLVAKSGYAFLSCSKRAMTSIIPSYSSLGMLCSLRGPHHRASFINSTKLICFSASQLRICQLLLGLTGAIFNSLKLLFRMWCGLAWVLSL